MDLFVCWANVWRSQVAEWFVKNIWIKVISCASVEARKEKYDFIPGKVITKIMVEKYNIDISTQHILYPNDIINHIDQINNIYFLFDPKKAKKSDDEVLIENKTLWNYFDNIWKKYNIIEIEDPDWKDESKKYEIVSNIEKVIYKIYKK